MSKSKKNPGAICGICKQGFIDVEAAQQHAIDRHPYKRSGIYTMASAVGVVHDNEPSFGERAAQAEVDKACGDDYEGWLLGE